MTDRDGRTLRREIGRVGRSSHALDWDRRSAREKSARQRRFSSFLSKFRVNPQGIVSMRRSSHDSSRPPMRMLPVCSDTLNIAEFRAGSDLLSEALRTVARGISLCAWVLFTVAATRKPTQQKVRFDHSAAEVSPGWQRIRSCSGIRSGGDS